MFRIVPRRRDQRYPAGKCLERTNGRDARQVLHIGAPRNMHRHPMLGEGKWNPCVGDPAAEGDIGILQCLLRMVGIAHSMHQRLELKCLCRFHQKLDDLCGAFIVTPIADPDQVARLVRLRYRPEQGVIGSLMPGKHGTAPAGFQIPLA